MQSHLADHARERRRSAYAYRLGASRPARRLGARIRVRGAPEVYGTKKAI